MKNSYSLSISELQQHEEHQDSILQATRNLHYVFQTIFLGLAFTVLSIGFATLFVDSNEYSRMVVLLPISVSVSTFILIGCILLFEYSNAIVRRGIVVDLIQHLRILMYQNKLDTLLSFLLKTRREGEIFILIKIAESMGRHWEAHKSSNSLHASIRTELERKGFFKYLKFLPIESTENFSIFPYLLFYNDIFESDYLDNLDQFAQIARNDNKKSPEEKILNSKIRNISRSRKGHRAQLLTIWIIVAILLAVLNYVLYINN